MNENQSALIQLVDKIEQLGQFQDKIEFPASVQQIWEAFLNDVRNLIEVEGCALFLVDEVTQEFGLSCVEPPSVRAACQEESDAQIECGIFPWVLKRRQPALIPALGPVRGRTLVMLPLVTVKRTLGMVMVISPLHESLVTQENMRLLAVLAKQCSLVMENALLYEGLKKKNESLEKANKQIRYLAQRDPLTRCFNRGYMNEQLPRDIRRALRYRRALSVALCDLDHFKAINDTQGHQCGDQVLRDFVKTVSALIRTDSDWLARYGGEEFLLVLPETSLENAQRLAERLRQQIARRTFDWHGEQVCITASFGLTGFDGERVTEKIAADALLRCVDENLYRAKKEGRNRVFSGAFAG
ncbi:MAG: sensor domain-containing diguanylate cyclase [Desulfobacterales bacterium]|jgi:diguanylate cyclase (GGDEF)-like protein|nr:sensor domain-containing diguanylate cyclase [Desulfobacterales bacterium]